MAISGIPMVASPWESFKQGFSFDDNLMKQILERKQLKQKADQYKEDIALRKAQLEINRMSAGRAAQAAADNHRIAMDRLDPLSGARRYEALENYFKSKGKSGGGQTGNYGASATNEPIPEQEMGQGMGMYSTEGLQNAKQRPSLVEQEAMSQDNSGGPDLDLIRKYPALRGAYKKLYGFDPLAIDKANELHGFARDAADLEKLRIKEGENSNAYRNAKALFDSKLGANGANADLNRQILQEDLLKKQHANDPTWEAQQLKAKIDYINNMRNEGVSEQAIESFITGIPTEKQMPARQIPAMEQLDNGSSFIEPMGSAFGPPDTENIMSSLVKNKKSSGQLNYMPSISNMFHKQSEIPQIPEVQRESYLPNIPEYEEDSRTPPASYQGNNNASGLPGGLNEETIKSALIYKSLGLKVPANGLYPEPPEVKRANELRDKKEEIKYKHDLDAEDLRTKEDLKNEATKTKLIEDTKKDLPLLKETLRSLNIMKKIVEDKKNADMFDHWAIGNDQAAKMSKNPNTGTWQVYGIDPIIKISKELSARGSQLALKSSLGNKANFAEDQSVARAKILGSIDKIERAIARAEKLVGSSAADEEIKEHNGKKYKKISGEWYEVS
jgi:hypothetical protein